VQNNQFGRLRNREAASATDVRGLRLRSYPEETGRIEFGPLWLNPPRNLCRWVEFNNVLTSENPAKMLRLSGAGSTTGVTAGRLCGGLSFFCHEVRHGAGMVAVSRHVKTMRNLVVDVGVAGAGLVAIALAAPAQARSIQGFFNTVSVHAQPRALRMALTTETFRNQQAGNTSFVACMARELIPVGKEGGPRFDLMDAEISGSKEKAKESVESYVLGAIESFCPSKGVGHTLPGEKPATFNPTAVETFFAELPVGADKFDVLSLALSTQALRVINSGDQTRGLCIMDNLVEKKIDGETHLPAGLTNLAKTLGQAMRNSPTDPAEGQIIEAIISTCGAETKP
jgi:hypothetical protein